MRFSTEALPSVVVSMLSRESAGSGLIPAGQPTRRLLRCSSFWNDRSMSTWENLVKVNHLYRDDTLALCPEVKGSYAHKLKGLK